MDTTGMHPSAIVALTRIGALRDQEIRLAIEITQEVARARMHGSPWRMIGVALGTTTQAAWERFREPEPKRPKPGQGRLPLDTDASDEPLSSTAVIKAQHALDLLSVPPTT